MTVNDIPLLITSVLLTVVGIGLLLYWVKKNGHLDFLRKSHYYSLIFLLIAGICTWIGMVFPVNPEKFVVTKSQWAALGFSIGISVLWWGRYIFSISPDTEKVEED